MGHGKGLGPFLELGSSLLCLFPSAVLQAPRRCSGDAQVTGWTGPQLPLRGLGVRGQACPLQAPSVWVSEGAWRGRPSSGHLGRLFLRGGLTFPIPGGVRRTSPLLTAGTG